MSNLLSRRVFQAMLPKFAAEKSADSQLRKAFLRYGSISIKVRVIITCQSVQVASARAMEFGYIRLKKRTRLKFKKKCLNV